MTLDQFLGLYNYWVVIFLMMTGFYIVIASENLIKTIIGLNIFQTSVFLLYITMGKVTGGKVPILKPDDPNIYHPHGHEKHGEAAHGAAEHAIHFGAEPPTDFSGVETITGSNSVTTELTSSQVLDKLLDQVDASAAGEVASQIIPVGFEEVAHIAEVAHAAGDNLYTNPLPSVLMLTAIVVGIATTALALALIVRIREEYGTIEEDEILELDRKS
jgi:multicomponent Na+:H+ antiporter subunit C